MQQSKKDWWRWRMYCERATQKKCHKKSCEGTMDRYGTYRPVYWRNWKELLYGCWSSKIILCWTPGPWARWWRPCRAQRTKSNTLQRPIRSRLKSSIGMLSRTDKHSYLDLRAHTSVHTCCYVSIFETQLEKMRQVILQITQHLRIRQPSRQNRSILHQ